MFSSGSEGSPRHERELARGLSSLTPMAGDVFESSGGATNPIMSPVLGRMMSASSALEGMLLGSNSGDPLDAAPVSPDGEVSSRAAAAAARGASPYQPAKYFPDAEEWRGRGSTDNGSSGGGRVGRRTSSGHEREGQLENRKGGAHLGGLPLPAGYEGGVPNGGNVGAGAQQGSGGCSGDSSGGSSGGSSPGVVRRRGRPLPLSQEPKPEATTWSGKTSKRRHVPTPKHRVLPGAWGTLPAEETASVAAADGESRPGGEDQQAGSECASSRITQSSSDFNSDSNKTPSDSGAPAPAAAAAARGSGGLGEESVVPPPPPSPPPPSAPALPAPAAPTEAIHLSGNSGIPASDLLSEFDSNTTWAGASALSVATTRTGWGSVLDTSSALSQYPSSHLSTTAAKLDAAAVWTQQPPGRNGDVNGVSVVTANRRNRARASPSHNLRVVGGTPARRGIRGKPETYISGSSSSNSRGAGGSGVMNGGVGSGAGEDPSKPRTLTRPASISRKAAMSPHGVAMDAALRIVEEQGARLGIVKEEKEDAAAAAAATAAAANSSDGFRDAAYANQIAAPAMTSLEQRRQRAKAWAKSRAGGTSHQIRTGAMPTLDKNGKKVSRPRERRGERRGSGDSRRGGSDHHHQRQQQQQQQQQRSSGRGSSESAHRQPNNDGGHAYSSSGSEADIGNPSHDVTTPARSRQSSRSALGATPARPRASSRNGSGSGGAGRAPLLPRGTARDRHSATTTPARDRHANGGGEGSSRRTRSSAGPSGGGSSDGRGPFAGGGGGGDGRRGSTSAASTSSRGAGSERRETPSRSGRRSSTPSSSGSVRGASRERPKSSAKTSGGGGGSGSSKGGPAGGGKQDMSSLMASMMVAPLSRPIPTESIGYLYGENADDSRSSTPQPSPSPPPVPPAPSRTERAKRRASGGSGGPNSPPNYAYDPPVSRSSRADNVAEEAAFDGYGGGGGDGSSSRHPWRQQQHPRVKGGSPPPPMSPPDQPYTSLVRSSSTPTRDRVGDREHERRSSSNALADLEKLATAKATSARRAAAAAAAVAAARHEGEGGASVPGPGFSGGRRERADVSPSGRTSDGGGGGGAVDKGASPSPRSSRSLSSPSQSRHQPFGEGGERPVQDWEWPKGSEAPMPSPKSGSGLIGHGGGGSANGAAVAAAVSPSVKVEATAALDALSAAAGPAAGPAAAAAGSVALERGTTPDPSPEASPRQAAAAVERSVIPMGRVASIAANTNKKVREGTKNTYAREKASALSATVAETAEKERDTGLAEQKARAAANEAMQSGTRVAAQAAAKTAAAVWAQREAESKAKHAAAAQVARREAEAKALEASKALDRAKAAAAAATASAPEYRPTSSSSSLSPSSRAAPAPAVEGSAKPEASAAAASGGAGAAPSGSVTSVGAARKSYLAAAAAASAAPVSTWGGGSADGAAHAAGGSTAGDSGGEGERLEESRLAEAEAARRAAVEAEAIAAEAAAAEAAAAEAAAAAGRERSRLEAIERAAATAREAEAKEARDHAEEQWRRQLEEARAREKREEETRKRQQEEEEEARKATLRAREEARKSAEEARREAEDARRRREEEEDEEDRQESSSEEEEEEDEGSIWSEDDREEDESDRGGEEADTDPPRVQRRAERGESSESAEMLSEEVEEDEDEDPLDSSGRMPQSSEDYAESLLADHAAAVLQGKEDQQQAFAIHRAVFDNDVDYLEILLDHAVEAQEEEKEARMGTSGAAPAAFSSVGGAEEVSQDVPPSAATGPGGMDEVDHHGNTPLLLALQLGRLECANALLEAGANVDIKSGRRYHLMDEAVLTGDQAIVRQVYMRAQQQTWLRWQERLPHLLDILEEIPDFYVEMKWSFSAAFLMAPLMQAVAPSDTYRIWKRGSWLRIDSTIVGVGARFKLKRGRLSLVFMGKDSATPGVLLRVDHTKSKVYNALRRLEWETNREVDKAVHNLMASSNKGGVDSTQFKAKKTVFREASQKSEGGQQVQAVMAGWKCSTYQYLGSMQMKTTRKGGNVVQYVPKEKYFDTRGEKPLLAKAREALAREDTVPAPGTGVGGGGLKKGVGASMFQKPFWKNNQDLNEDKVHRQINKQVKATVWMAHNYPLKLKHIMPALEILSVRDDMAARLRSVLSLAGIPQEGFPVKVSVPLMMTVKAVVTFENFQSDGIDPRNFVVPSEYQRSRRMSKEKYIAGVGAGGGGGGGGGLGGGGGGGGENGERGNSGAFDSDEEEEEEEEDDYGDDDVDEADMSDGELLRRRAASRNAFDDDEEDDSDFEDDLSEDFTPSSSRQTSNADMSAPQSPVLSQPSPPEMTAPVPKAMRSAGGVDDDWVSPPAAPTGIPSEIRGRQDSSSAQKAPRQPQPRGRSSSGNSNSNGNGGSGVGGFGRRVGGPGVEDFGAVKRQAGSGRAAPGEAAATAAATAAAAHKRHRSKSRSGRLVSQIKGIVGAGKSKSARRGSLGGSGATTMSNGGRGGGIR